MRRIAASLGTVLLLAAMASAQFISNAPQNRAAAKMQPVQYLFPEQVRLPAGKPATVLLHFRVAPGLHINSHRPGGEFLIPTTFSVPAGAGARLQNAIYPSGTDMSLPADPKTRLNVYTGDFTIEARLVASAGDHLVQGKLHYQACNDRQCMPPQTITVPIDVIGK